MAVDDNYIKIWKRYILGEKFEIELRISFESATLDAYDAVNRNNIKIND